MAILGKHGITAATPGAILLGAGTYHKNLKFETGKWTGDCIGATSGGGKVSIAGEFVDMELDGALVKVKGLTVKQGGTASMEVNFVELSTDMLMTTTLMEVGESDAEGFTMLKDKAHITEGDYLENFGFVGMTADGSKQIIVIFDYALCTSGLEVNTEKSKQSAPTVRINCVAPADSGANKLPYTIIWPEGEAAA
jgi:hypothetical protein